MREFETGEHAVLHVESRSGSVRVEGRQLASMQVEATVRMSSDVGSEIDDAVALVERAMEQDGNRVIIRAPSLPQTSGWRGLPFGAHGARVDYRILVPLHTAARVLSRSGAVEISHLEGRVHSEVLSGRCMVDDVHGEVTVVARSGAVQVERINGNVTAEARSGRLKLVDISGTVNAEARSGSMEVTKASGDVRLRGRNGPITVEDAGAAVQASSRCGPFRYTGRVEGDFDVEVNMGPILMAVDPERPFFIDAESQMGPVQSDLPPRRASSSGAAPTGPKVKLRTRMGPIKITRAI